MSNLIFNESLVFAPQNTSSEATNKQLDFIEEMGGIFMDQNVLIDKSEACSTLARLTALITKDRDVVLPILGDKRRGQLPKDAADLIRAIRTTDVGQVLINGLSAIFIAEAGAQCWFSASYSSKTKKLGNLTDSGNFFIISKSPLNFLNKPNQENAIRHLSKDLYLYHCGTGWGGITGFNAFRFADVRTASGKAVTSTAEFIRNKMKEDSNSVVASPEPKGEMYFLSPVFTPGDVVKMYNNLGFGKILCINGELLKVCGEIEHATIVRYGLKHYLQFFTESILHPFTSVMSDIPCNTLRDFNTLFVTYAVCKWHGKKNLNTIFKQTYRNGVSAARDVSALFHAAYRTSRSNAIAKGIAASDGFAEGVKIC